MYRAGFSEKSLGARLFCAGSQVRPGAAVADIGCDHGKLAVWLALRGGAARVIAVDSRPLPLARARARVLQTGCGNKVDCRLGSGLAPLAAGEAEDIVVAGLSAETIGHILGACAWLQNPDVRLVLVPATRHARLRRWLCQNGFALLQEHLVAEQGRLYTVMVAGYTGRAYQPSALFCQLGLLADLPANKPLLQAYIKQRLAHLEKQALGCRSPGALAAHRQLIQEVAACLT